MLKWICCVILLVPFCLFVGFNWQSSCKISWFGQEADVRILLVALLSFALGIVVSLFFALSRKLRKAGAAKAKDGKTAAGLAGFFSRKKSSGGEAEAGGGEPSGADAGGVK